MDPKENDSHSNQRTKENQSVAVEKTNNETTVSHASVSCEVPSAPILNLDIDCFYELCDWLSLYDIIAIGQTCKRLHQLAGAYFRATYPSKRIVGEKGGLYIEYRRQVDLFGKFIKRISITGERLKVYRFVGANCKFLRQIRIGGSIPDGAIESIKEVLKRIEVVELFECSIRDEFFDYFLQFCPKLKSLSVTRWQNIRNKSVIIGSGNDWLLRKYPTLENLELIDLYEIQTNELTTFFQLNPQVRTFSMDSQSLWDNRQSFLNSGIKLDKLAVEFRSNEIDTELLDLLSELYEQELFRRLHIYSSNTDQCHLNKMFSTPLSNSIEMLHGIFKQIENPLENLTTIGFMYAYYSVLDMENLAKNLPNLIRIYFLDASSDHIAPFIRWSPELRFVKVFRMQGGTHCQRGFFDISQLNVEREKLAEANKVFIYVNESYIVWSKWSNIQYKFRLVTLARFESLEWKELNAKSRHDHLRPY